MLTYFRLNNKALLVHITVIILCVYYEPVAATNLMDVVNYALYNHPAVLFNEQLVDESKYRYYQTFGQFLPEVSLTRNQNNEKTFNTSIGINQPVILRARNNDFNLKQNLFAGFKDLHANRAAMWRYKSKRESATFNINAQVFEIVVNYINILQQEKLLRLAKENERFFQKSFDKLEKLYNKGVADKADFLLVKNNLQNARANTLQTQRDYNITTTKFKNLIDLEPSNLQPLKSISKYIEPNIGLIIENIVDSNPNVKEIEAKIKTLDYESKQSAGALMPSIDLQVSKNQAANLNGSKGTSGTTKIGITLNLNLLKGGQDYLEIQAKHAEKLSLIYQLEQTKRSIKQDATETWLNLKNAIDKRQSINEQIMSATQSLYSYLILFDYNRSYLLNVLNAKKLLLTSQMEKITNDSSKLINEYRILLLNNNLLDTIEKIYINTPLKATQIKDPNNDLKESKIKENNSTDINQAQDTNKDQNENKAQVTNEEASLKNIPSKTLTTQSAKQVLAQELNPINKPQNSYKIEKLNQSLKQSDSYQKFIEDYELFIQNNMELTKYHNEKLKEDFKIYLKGYEEFLTQIPTAANTNTIQADKAINPINDMNSIKQNENINQAKQKTIEAEKIVYKNKSNNNKSAEINVQEYLNHYEKFLNSTTNNTLVIQEANKPTMLSSANILNSFDSKKDTDTNKDQNKDKDKNKDKKVTNFYLKTKNVATNVPLPNNKIRDYYLKDYDEFIFSIKPMTKEELIKHTEIMLNVFNSYIKDYDNYINNHDI